jgi:hypothetical protein
MWAGLSAVARKAKEALGAEALAKAAASQLLQERFPA